MKSVLIVEIDRQLRRSTVTGLSGKFIASAAFALADIGHHHCLLASYSKYDVRLELELQGPQEGFLAFHFLPKHQLDRFSQL